MSQFEHFDPEEILSRQDEKNEPLARLNSVVDWTIFEVIFYRTLQKERRSLAGRKPWPCLLMFRVLILQELTGMSDDAAERIIDDRISFRRFIGLKNSRKSPDATTIWRFREALVKAGVIQELFDTFGRHLEEKGFCAKKGQIIDASIVNVPRQHNSRAENKAIKEGNPPDWPEAKKRQKDVDARWTKKNEESFFGYKNHLSVDVRYKFIRSFQVTEASVHDSQVFEELLRENTSRDVHGDSAYRSAENLEKLKELGYREHLQRKGQRNHPLTKLEKQGNRTRARIRSRVEHVFGAQLQRAGHLVVRTIGLARATMKIGLRNLAYNMDRLGFLLSA